MKTAFSSGRENGFTLIEIMVATAILLVIVVMCSMVIQQQSGAFQSGRDRVASQAALRTVVGMISRDLSQAVDDDRNSFGSGSITFYANTGNAGEGKTRQKISYSGSGSVTRSVDGSSVTIYEGTSPMTLRFNAEGGEAKYPAYVKVKASVAASANSSTVSGHSLGPNGRDDTAGSRVGDDIWVGGVPKN